MSKPYPAPQIPITHSSHALLFILIALVLLTLLAFFFLFFKWTAIWIKNQMPWVWQALRSNWCRPISALNFAYTLANHRPELKFDKVDRPWVARIPIMSHHMSKPCKTLPCPSDFHNTLFAPVTFPFNRSTYNNSFSSFFFFLHNFIWELKKIGQS